MKKRYILSIIFICFIAFIFILENIGSSNNGNNHQIAYSTYNNQNISFEYPKIRRNLKKNLNLKKKFELMQ